MCYLLPRTPSLVTHDSSHETSVTVSLKWAAVTSSAHLWPAEEQVAVLYSTVLCCAVLYCAVVTVQNMQQYTAQSECDLDHHLPVTSYTPPHCTG